LKRLFAFLTEKEGLAISHSSPRIGSEEKDGKGRSFLLILMEKGERGKEIYLLFRRKGEGRKKKRVFSYLLDRVNLSITLGDGQKGQKKKGGARFFSCLSA